MCGILFVLMSAWVNAYVLQVDTAGPEAEEEEAGEERELASSPDHADNHDEAGELGMHPRGASARAVLWPVWF